MLVITARKDEWIHLTVTDANGKPFVEGKIAIRPKAEHEKFSVTFDIPRSVQVTRDSAKVKTELRI